MAEFALTPELVATFARRFLDGALDYEAMEDTLKDVSLAMRAPILTLGPLPVQDAEISSHPPPHHLLEPRPLQLFWQAGVDPDLNAKLASEYLTEARNPFMGKIRRAKPAQPYTMSEMMAPNEYFAHPLYQEVFRPAGADHGIGAVVQKNGAIFDVLHLYRNLRIGDFSKDEKTFFAALIPYLSQAISLIYKFSSLERSAHDFFEAFQLLPQGILIVGSDRRIQFANAAAEAILRLDDAILNRKQYLHAKRPQTDRRLQSLVYSATHFSDTAPAHKTLAAPREWPRLPLMLTVQSLPRFGGDGPSDARAIVFISDASNVPRVKPNILEQAFGLTPAEAKLAAALVNGSSLSEAARNLSITRNTASTHLRHIFEKIGVNRQTDLVRTILPLVSSFR